MSKFKIYNSDFGIKYNGVNYDFVHVNEVTVDDPEVTRVTRGANGTNLMGLVYKEGLRDPKRWTVTIMGMSAALKGVLDEAFGRRDRLDVYCIDRDDGSSKMLKDAILCNRPQQLTIDESPDSLNVQLIFESFNQVENHKE